MNEQLSITLQAEETNVDDYFMAVDDYFMAVDDCFMALNFLHLLLERIRTDPNFKSIYDSVVVKVSKVLCDPPVLPCQRQLPRGLNDGAPQHTFTFIEDHYIKDYFEAIDCVKGELQRPFQQKKLLFCEKH